MTTRRLDESLGGKDELTRQVVELSQRLAKSEEQRVLSEKIYNFKVLFFVDRKSVV